MEEAERFDDDQDGHPVFKKLCHLSTNVVWNKDRHPFNGIFSRTTRVSRHQNGKTILDFNEARDDAVAVASAEPYENHLHLTAYR